MTRIDFYVLQGSQPKARQILACRLADKAYQRGHKVYIHTDSPEQTEQMNTLLWTFRQNSFVPHTTTDKTEQDQTPVLLGNSTAPKEHHEVLINLSSQMPEFFSQFDRVAELVDQNKERLLQSRERYKFYQERGYELKTHKLEA